MHSFLASQINLVALTDFILSIECLFMAGLLLGEFKSVKSPVGILGVFLLFVGLATFMGGVDHGFFEPIDMRYFPRTMTYIFVAGATFYLLRYCALLFFAGLTRKVIYSIAFIQMIVFVICSFYYHNFLLVVFNYAPILLFFFALNLNGLKSNKSNNYIVLFCVLIIIATLVQAFEIGLSESINGDTLYHIIAILAYIFFFIGAKRIAIE